MHLGHFIDESFKLNSIILDIFPLEHPHTAEEISDIIYQILQEWKKENSVLCITSDNAENMIRAGKLAKGEAIKRPEIEYDAPIYLLYHNRCAAHSIQIVIRQAMKIVDESISNDVVFHDILTKIRFIIF